MQAAGGGVTEGAGGGDEAARLRGMANMGIDVSIFKAALPSGREPAAEADRFGHDVDFVAGLLRRVSPRSDGPQDGEEGEDEEGEGEDMREWRASLSENFGAAEKGRQELEQRKSELEGKRWAAVLEEAKAARIREKVRYLIPDRR